MLSRPVMDHLTRLAMIFSVVEQLRQSEAWNVKSVRQAATDMNYNRRLAKIGLLNHCKIPYTYKSEATDCDGVVMHLQEADNLKLHRHERRLIAWVTDSLEKNFDAGMWMNAVLAEAERQYNLLPDSLDHLREYWQRIIDCMNVIYAAYDPDLEDTESMRNGVKYANRMQGVG
jgi:hypothetical protein